MKKISILGILIILLIFLFCLNINASSATIKPYTKYVNIEIQPNDTLWNIALKYKSKDENTKDYVKKIKQINNMSGDTILYGDYLIIPINQY